MAATFSAAMTACSSASLPPDDDRSAITGSGAGANAKGDSAKGAKPAGVGLKTTLGFAFIHGTGDVADTKDLLCSAPGGDFRCEVKGATDDYWTQTNIDLVRSDSAGVKRPYVAIGCKLGTLTPWPNATPVKGGSAPLGSADCTAAQIHTFLAGPDGVANTADDITDLYVVTHSGGSNVIRYILQQHSASADFGAVHAASRRVLTIAPPTHGTYLANWVFTRGTLGNVAQKLSVALGGSLYDGDGTFFIQTSTMDLFNKDAARFGGISKDVAGVPFHVAAGTYPHAQLGDDDSKCAGYEQTLGLQFLHETYLTATDTGTYRDGCSDGFITCQSAMALAEGDASRILFGRGPGGKIIGKTEHRAHNQSRRDCDGIGTEVRDFFNGVAKTDLKTQSLVITGDTIPAALRSREWYVRADDTSARAGVNRLAGTNRVSLFDTRTGDTRITSADEARALAARGEPVVLEHREGAAELVAERTQSSWRHDERATMRVHFDDAGAVLANTQLEAHAFQGDREVPVTVERTGELGAFDVRVGALSATREGIVWVRLAASAEQIDGMAQRTLDVPVRFVEKSATLQKATRVTGGARIEVAVDSAGRYGVHATWIAPDGARSQAQASATLARGAGALVLPFPAGTSANEAGGWRLENIALVRHDFAATVDSRNALDVL